MFREIEKVFFTIDTKKAYEYSRLVQLMWLLFKGTIAFEVSFIANDYENFVNRFTYNFGPIWNSLSTHQDWSVAKKKQAETILTGNWLSHVISICDRNVGTTLVN